MLLNSPPVLASTTQCSLSAAEKVDHSFFSCSSNESPQSRDIVGRFRLGHLALHPGLSIDWQFPGIPAARRE